MEEFNSKSSNAEMTTKKERHGFVTFWLWLGIISNILMIPISIYTYHELLQQWNYETIRIAASSDAICAHILIMDIVTAVTGILMIIFYIQIKKWEKRGFWGIVITAVITAIINVIMMTLINNDFSQYDIPSTVNPLSELITELITTSISLLVLFGILQTKKNGISCWKQLESRPHKDSSSDRLPEQNEENKKIKIGLLILMGVLITAATSAIVVFTNHFLNPTEEDYYEDRTCTEIQDIFVCGSDIYAVGCTNNGSSGTDIPTLWKNGQLQEIGNEGNFNQATSVFVAGDDIYVTINESSNDQALLWKNGESQVLAEGSYAQANCVYVYDNNVYVAGQKNEQPTLWINGEPKVLGETGSATAVLVKDNKVYVAGYFGEYFSPYREGFLYMFKNNDEEMAFNIEMSLANSIFVTDDGEIFVVGEANNKAALWKQDGLYTMEDGTVQSIAVDNAGKTIMAGTKCDSYSSAVVWNSIMSVECHDILGFQAMAVATDGNVFYIGGCSSDGRWAVYKYDANYDFRSDNFIRVPESE